MNGREQSAFIDALHTSFMENEFDDEENFEDEDFRTLTSVTTAQFREIFSKCDPVPDSKPNQFRIVEKKDLIMFLCKMRQGNADEFSKVIFRYSTRQKVSLKVAIVRKSLMAKFVPENIGFNAITREEFIERHVPPFANELYNQEPSIPKAIV